MRDYTDIPSDSADPPPPGAGAEALFDMSPPAGRGYPARRRRAANAGGLLVAALAFVLGRGDLSHLA